MGEVGKVGKHAAFSHQKEINKQKEKGKIKEKAVSIEKKKEESSLFDKGFKALGNFFEDFEKKKESIKGKIFKANAVIQSVKNSTQEARKKAALRFDDLSLVYPNIFEASGSIQDHFDMLDDNGLFLENFEAAFWSDKTINTLLKQVDNLANKLPEKDKEVLRSVVGDLYFFSNFVPVKYTEKDREHFFRESIEILTPQDFKNILRDLSRSLASKNKASLNIKNIFKDCPAISHISPDHLKSQKPLQRALNLSLGYFNTSYRDVIQKDPLFQKVLQKDNLADWMLSNSGSLEQQFLNSCESSSFSQHLLSQISVPTGLMIVTKAFIDDSSRNYKKKYLRLSKKLGKKKLAEGRKAELEKDMERLKYGISKLSEIKREFADLEVRLEALVELRQPPTTELKKVVLDWSKLLQKLSVTGDPNKIAAPTDKIIKDQWLLSAFIVSVPILMGLDQIFTENPPPEKAMRTDPGTLKKDLDAFENSLKEEDFLETDPFYLKKDNEVIKAKDILNEIWDEAFKARGVTAAIENRFGAGHAIYMKPALINEELGFFIGDPKVSYYSFKTFEDMEELLDSSMVKTCKVYLPKEKQQAVHFDDRPSKKEFNISGEESPKYENEIKAKNILKSLNAYDKLKKLLKNKNLEKEKKAELRSESKLLKKELEDSLEKYDLTVRQFRKNPVLPRKLKRKAEGVKGWEERQRKTRKKKGRDLEWYSDIEGQLKTKEEKKDLSSKIAQLQAELVHRINIFSLENGEKELSLIENQWKEFQEVCKEQKKKFGIKSKRILAIKELKEEIEKLEKIHKKYIQNQRSKNTLLRVSYPFNPTEELNLSGDLEVFQTHGDGSCALHAIFGKPTSDNFKAKHYQEIRKELAEVVVKSLGKKNIKDPKIKQIKGIAQNGILLLLESSEEKISKKFQAAVEEVYQELSSQKEELSQEINEISNWIQGSLGQIQFLSDKREGLLFNEPFDQEEIEKLEEKIGEIQEEIERKEHEKNKKIKKVDRLVKNILTHPKVIKAYSAYLQDPSNYLLQDEVEMFALLNNVSVRLFQPGWGHHKNELQVSELNPGQKKKVDVFYNGESHYEKAEFKSKAK